MCAYHTHHVSYIWFLHGLKKSRFLLEKKFQPNQSTYLPHLLSASILAPCTSPTKNMGIYSSVVTRCVTLNDRQGRLSVTVITKCIFFCVFVLLYLYQYQSTRIQQKSLLNTNISRTNL